jgi:PAS domain S-box-containing protein
MGRAMKKKLDDGSEQPPSTMKDQIESSFSCKIDAVEGMPCPFEAIFEQVAIGIAYVALDGQLLRVNRYICNMIRYDRNEMLRHSLFDFTPEEEKEDFRTFFERCIREGATGRTVEKRSVRGDGSSLWVSMTLSLVKKVTGEPGYVIAAIQDISERKRAEEERSRLAQHTQEVLHSLLAMAEALVAVDDSEREQREPLVEQGYVATAISEVGQRLVELTGSVLGGAHTMIAAIEPDQSDEEKSERVRPIAAFGIDLRYQTYLMDLLQGALLNDYFSIVQIERLRAGEMTFIASCRPLFEGKENLDDVPCDVLVAPMRINGVLVGVLVLEKADSGEDGREQIYTQDEIALVRAVARLTALALEREHLLQERTEAKANALVLREANRRMDEFLSIASHELKNPLAAIKGNVQLAGRRLHSTIRRSARESGSEDKERFKGAFEALGIADRQVSRLNRLVGDLLDVSRIQVGKMEMHLATVDLRAIVHDAVESQRLATPERTIHLKESVQEPLFVTADSDRIEQVIINYLVNAIKYSPEDSVVEVSLGVDDGEALIEVCDEGPGLSEDQLQLIWERFHQVNGGKKQLGSASGLGLGLYISKTIIEQHHGRYGVRSTPGAGSIFWFSLSLQSNHPPVDAH